MGRPLCDLLAERGADVTSVSRSKPDVLNEKIHYLHGNINDREFCKELFNSSWDCIVDFMVYTTDHFKEIIDLYLKSTKQYVFISSARVYDKVPEGEFITEESARLLESCTDETYLKTDEYALAKARQEDILKFSGRKNWTVIRPSVTYNTQRLQLGGFEKEEWLYRVLKGRSLVFSEDLVNVVTTMTLGDDVSRGICGIVGKKETLGEIYHITEKNYLTWGEVLELYLDVLQERLGRRPKVVYTKESVLLKFRKYQMIYAKMLNRKFDNTKIGKYIDVDSFVTAREGLKKCLNAFLDDVQFKKINWYLESKNDKSAHEFTAMREIIGSRNKLKYVLSRFGLEKIGLKIGKGIFRI